MPHLETGHNPDQLAPIYVDSDRDRRLNPSGLLEKGDALVDSVHAKGKQQATALANSLGGELDPAIRADLLRTETRLARAKNALAHSLAGFPDAAAILEAPSPTLQGYEEGDEHAGAVEEMFDREFAVAYLKSPASERSSFEQNVAYLESKGVNATETVSSFVEAGRWGEVIKYYDMSGPAGDWIYDAIVATPNGLERLASEYPQTNYLGMTALHTVFNGPDGVNRTLRHAGLFKDAGYHLSSWVREIKADPNLNPGILLDAIRHFSGDRYLVENLTSSLESSRGISEQDDSVGEKIFETAMTLAGNGLIAEALRIVKATGTERKFSENPEFANALNAAFGGSPEIILPLLERFPLLAPLLKSNEDVKQGVISGWLLDHVGPGRLPVVRDAIDAYGITWEHAMQNYAVRSWTERPVVRGRKHEILTDLIDLLRPTREDQLRLAEKALMSELRIKEGSFDEETFRSVHDMFGLTPEERVANGPPEIGYRLIRDQLENSRSDVSEIVVGIVNALDSGKDAFLERMKSPEMKSLAWRNFDTMMACKSFDVAERLQIFGLSPEEMTKRARAEYFRYLRDGLPKHLTKKLIDTFDIGEENIPRSEIDPAIRQGIETCIRANSLSMLARYVGSREVSPNVAEATAADVQAVERIVTHDLQTYFTLGAAERARLDTLFGITPDLFARPDAATVVADQGSRMIRDANPSLAQIREAMPWIRETLWYGMASRERMQRNVSDAIDHSMETFLRFVDLPISFFRTTNIVEQAKRTADAILKNGRYDKLGGFEHYFGVSPRDGMRKVLESGDPRPLYQFGRLIDAKTASAWKDGGIRSYIEAMERANPKLSEEITEYYTKSRNFDGLAMAIELGVAAVPFFDESDIVRELQKMERSGDAIAAESLLRCYGLSGKLLDPGLRYRIKVSAGVERERRERRETRELDKEDHRVEEELTSFYLDEYIGVELATLERKMADRHAEPSFRTKMDIHDHRAGIRRNTENQFVWMREYLVRSALGEIGHESDSSRLPTSRSAGLPMDTDAWMAVATSEEIRRAMAAATLRFQDIGWNPSYGGKPWANISSTAERMFASNAEKRSLIDLVYDLQHNNGTVFNKDRRITYDPNAIQRLLDMKREVSEPESYLALLRAHVSPEIHAKVSRRWDDWKTLRSRLEREAGSGPEKRRDLLVDEIRKLANSADERVEKLAKLEEEGTAELELLNISQERIVGSKRREYVLETLVAALRNKITEFGNGDDGVVDRLLQGGLARSVETDELAPLIKSYLEARKGVIADRIQASLVAEVLGVRYGFKTEPNLNAIMIPPVIDQLARILPEISK